MILYMRNSKIQFNHLLSHSTSWYWSYSDLLAYWSLLAMSRSLSASLCFRILRLLLLHWCFKDIIKEIHCHFDIIYRIQKNLFMYNSFYWKNRVNSITSDKIYLDYEEKSHDCFIYILSLMTKSRHTTLSLMLVSRELLETSLTEFRLNSELSQ